MPYENCYMKFKLIKKEDYNILLPYYISLKKALADLNAMMMLAWQEVLNLSYAIDHDDILYVIGEFEGVTWGWGPPLGNSVKEKHIYNLMHILQQRNSTHKPAIRYVWKEYPLFNKLKSSSKLWNISSQTNEYIYDCKVSANLTGDKLKKLRKEKNRFERHYKPQVIPYSLSLKDHCLQVLNLWYKQKSKKLLPEYRDKFELESQVCYRALREGLSLEGVVIYVGREAQAFSLGSTHCFNCFNCMFEKSNLLMNGLSSYVFSALGEYCLPNFKEINAGEDWGVDYLASTKKKWYPVRIQQSFILSGAEQ